MPWHAKSGCVEHHHAALKRIVNTLSLSYLLLSSSGELFKGLEDYNRRLYDYVLTEGFDIIRYGGGIKILFSYKFRYIFYDSKI